MNSLHVISAVPGSVCVITWWCMSRTSEDNDANGLDDGDDTNGSSDEHWPLQ